MLRNRVARRRRERHTADRGMWTPSGPLIVVGFLLVAIALTAGFISISSMNPLGTDTEVTTVSNTSLINDDEAVAVTVIEKPTDKPVEGATVSIVSDDVRLDSPPNRTTNETGTVVYEFGSDVDEVTIDWSANSDFGTLTFEVEPGEGRVDHRSNSELTVQRS